MRLVKIDVETGDITPVLEQKGIDFMEKKLFPLINFTIISNG